MHLAVNNPLRLMDYGDWFPEEILHQLKQKGMIDDSEIPAIIKSGNSAQSVRDYISGLGYDSVIYLNRYEGLPKTVDHDDRLRLTDKEFKEKYPEAQDSYIAIKPSQIKSAMGNKGTWDSEQDSIIRENKMSNNIKRLIEQAIQSKLPGAVVKQIRLITESKKPSAGLTKKEKSSVVKKAKAGKDIGKKGKGFDALAKKAGGGEKGKKIAAAAMWRGIKREDVDQCEMPDDLDERAGPVSPSGKAKPWQEMMESYSVIIEHEGKKKRINMNIPKQKD